MSLTDPSILSLLEKADCRYTLAMEVSKRARQLVDGADAMVDTKDREIMPVAIAVDEVDKGFITYTRSPEIDVR